MSQIKITRDCSIDGTSYNAGAVVEDTAIPEGSWPSVRLMGLVEPYTPEEPATPVESDSQESPSKKGKK